jgi:hypothetical protein
MTKGGQLLREGLCEGRRTADPSASLGMTKGRAVAEGGLFGVVLDCAYPFFPTSSRSHRGHHDPGIACKKRPTANPAIPLPKATHSVIAARCFGLLRPVARIVAS